MNWTVNTLAYIGESKQGHLLSDVFCVKYETQSSVAPDTRQSGVSRLC